MPSVVEVRIFRADLGDAEIAALCATLDADEARRAAGFGRPADRARFVVGRAAARRLLAERLRRPPCLIAFRIGPHGKPEPTDAAVRFNVSHSGDLVAVAVADFDVGVDIEARRALDDPHRLAAGNFAAEEAAALRLSPDPLTEFFRIWTAKEAVVKAIGDGLTLGLRNFVVPQDEAPPDAGRDATPRPIRAVGGDPSLARYGVARLAVPPGYAAAVAAKGLAWRVELVRDGFGAP